MTNPIGFKEYHRELPGKKPVEERIHNFSEFIKDFPEEKLIQQAARCMDCGIPFCHSGCPLGNLIPDWNDLIYQHQWEEALTRLHATNNFPEFTGRICPAPCEEACVLGITNPPVTIENIELTIIEHAFDQGWVEPDQPLQKTGKSVAIIGSGPAGLAAAQQLNRAGHSVTIFERDAKAGGLLRYGIPNFKLEKWVVERRINLLYKEGIDIKTGINIGVNYAPENLQKFDAIILAGGARQPRDLPIPGRELNGIHFAMDYLTQQNKQIEGHDLGNTQIHAKGKKVIVIGGGDTGSDCIGTANRQKAARVYNFELFPKPPAERPPQQPWPYYPSILHASSSHEEGCQREWGIMTKEFIGSQDRVERVKTVRVEFQHDENGRTHLHERPNTEETWSADLVLLAMGFTGPEKNGILDKLNIELDNRGNVNTNKEYMTNIHGIFSAGDMRRGQSLIVWAISEGREAAYYTDKYLMGFSRLPRKGKGDLPRA